VTLALLGGYRRKADQLTRTPQPAGRNT
jgi:hypothetical protein